MDLYTRIAKAKLFIDDHYAGPLNLKKLSGEACLSKYHFLRLFKLLYNKTPYQYLSERRIEKAREKLKYENLKVREICEDVGFESTTSFSIKFKAYTGETPAVFRLRSMQEQQLAKEQPGRFIPSCFSSQFNPKN
jgi:AraC-like DNA-binding protein